MARAAYLDGGWAQQMADLKNHTSRQNNGPVSFVKLVLTALMP